MSRWKSSGKAARRAAEVAAARAKQRTERRKLWLWLAGFAVLSIGLCVADYLWLRHQAKQRHEQRHHRGGGTNAPAGEAPTAGPDHTTHHE